MANAFLNLYKGNPTSGGTDGTQISLGEETQPLTFSLAASDAETGKEAIALRCETGFQTTGLTTVSFTGTTAARWSVSDAENGTFAPSLTINDTIGAANHLVWVQATSAVSEAPGNDDSVDIRVQTVAVPTP